MADNSAQIPTSEIHNRPTVTSDAIRDLLLGTQTVPPPPENSFESRPVGDAARVTPGDQTIVERGAPDSRGAAPPGGVGAAANSVSTSRQNNPLIRVVCSSVRLAVVNS